MELTITDILGTATIFWLAMVLIDGLFNITTPKVDHWYKNVGEALMLLTAIGWVLFALAHLATGRGVNITGG